MSSKDKIYIWENNIKDWTKGYLSKSLSCQSRIWLRLQNLTWAIAANFLLSTKKCIQLKVKVTSKEETWAKVQLTMSYLSTSWNFSRLRKKIKRWGVKNNNQRILTPKWWKPTTPFKANYKILNKYFWTKRKKTRMTMKLSQAVSWPKILSSKKN